MRYPLRFLSCVRVPTVCFLVLLVPGLSRAEKPDLSLLPPAAEKSVDFARDVYPLLKKNCMGCHAGANSSSGTRLDLEATVLGETNGLPLVLAGKSAESRLIHLVSGVLKDKVMPPEGDRLSPGDVGVLRAWIDQGVSWDEELFPPLSKSAAAQYWSFQPIRDTELPAVEDPDWVLNPIDAFISARHGETGVSRSPQANRATLLRRLSLTLRGLPPSPDEVAVFVNDDAPDAYERLVDRLLASPNYGERWGRHWLDVARWAESEGYAMNTVWKFAWRYRDYVVESFNADKPFSEFVKQQVAGDEMEPLRDENLVATGFLATARLSADDLDIFLVRNNYYVDVVNATTSAFLGLTVGCAQCHDHKFDPVTQKDYYRFQAFFANGLPGHLILKETQQPPEGLEDAARERREFRLKAYERILSDAYGEESPEFQEIVKLTEPERSLDEQALYRRIRARLNIRLLGCNSYRLKPEEKKKLDELKKIIDKLGPQARQTWGFWSPVTSPHHIDTIPMTSNVPIIHDKKTMDQERTYLLRRGNVLQLAAVVEPGWPEIFGSLDSPLLKKRPRLALAEWLTSDGNPLTSRVWANRVWHYQFGRGIVTTPGNFGNKGNLPTHPALLDWLATELARGEWSTKRLQRAIVTSNTYRQSARFDADNAKVDPKNVEYWRWPRRRLEAEGIRDSLLAASGQLDGRLGGPSVLAGRDHSLRRSLYLFQKRDAPPSLQAMFDGPTAMAASCAERFVSTTALQPLYLLNNEYSVRVARGLAARVVQAAGDDPEEQVAQAFSIALARYPDEAERRAALEYLAPGDGTADDAVEALAPAERGLSIWLKASDGVETPDGKPAANGDPVALWRDVGFGENHATNDVSQSDPKRQPRFVDNPEENINGQPFIRFGPEQLLEAVDSDELDLTTEYTFFAVARFRNDSKDTERHTSDLILAKARDESGKGAYSLGRFWTKPDDKGKPNPEGGKLSVRQNRGEDWSDQFVSPRLPDKQPLLLVVDWANAAIKAVVFGGETPLSRQSRSHFGAIDPGSGGPLGVGGSTSLSEYLNGDIGELLVYRKQLTHDEKEAVIRYLERRWALGTKPQSRLVRFCHTLVNTNEFVYVE